MTDPAADAARSAAAILAPDLGPNLPGRGRGSPGRPRHPAAPGPVSGPGLAGQPDRGHRHPGLDHLQRPAQPHPRPAA